MRIRSNNLASYYRPERPTREHTNDWLALRKGFKTIPLTKTTGKKNWQNVHPTLPYLLYSRKSLSRATFLVFQVAPPARSLNLDLVAKIHARAVWFLVASTAGESALVTFVILPCDTMARKGERWYVLLQVSSDGVSNPLHQTHNELVQGLQNQNTIRRNIWAQYAIFQVWRWT